MMAKYRLEGDLVIDSRGRIAMDVGVVNGVAYRDNVKVGTVSGARDRVAGDESQIGEVLARKGEYAMTAGYRYDLLAGGQKDKRIEQMTLDGGAWGKVYGGSVQGLSNYARALTKLVGAGHMSITDARARIAEYAKASAARAGAMWAELHRQYDGATRGELMYGEE